MKHLTLVVFLLVAFALALLSCHTDNSSSSTDDDVDDDAVDDDVDDDAVDDDTTDDDTADDDVTGEEQSPVCANPFDSGDGCADAMRTIYCGMRLPVIFERHWYSQIEAVEACRQAASPVWEDIVNCVLESLGLAVCLQQHGWAPELPEIFDAEHWAPTQPNGWTTAQALNFFYYHREGDFTTVIYNGGIVYPSTPLLRVNAVIDTEGMFDMTTAYLTGRSTFYSHKRIDFWLWGALQCQGENCFNEWMPTWRNESFYPLD